MKTVIGSIIGILAILASFFGAYHYVDNWKADSAEVKMIRQDLDYDRAIYQKDVVDGKIMKIEQEYKKVPMPESVKDSLRELRERRENLKKKIEKLEK